MNKYHMRREEKQITQQDELMEIINKNKVFSLAMCNDNDPYLVSMNYGYDITRNCFYFHTAKEGKKIDYLENNPKVWGEIREDHGYLIGECDHAYRTLHFEGKVEFVEDEEKKKRALNVMIHHIEPDPEPIKKRFIEKGDLEEVKIGKIDIKNIWGKKGGIE
ncbi:MAG: pyridoxamine 5'-phosphate oxidase family protein [Thermoplasmatota archaeon]